MSFEEKELQIRALEELVLSLDSSSDEFIAKKNELKKLKEEAYQSLTAWDRVCIARGVKRPKASDLIRKLLGDFVELKGDQYFGEDESIIAGIGFLNEMPITVLAQAKGRNINENMRRNFGMTSPEGFRKTLRLAKQAEKFNRPILTIVDTSGAYPGKGAEERGQSRAIAQNLMEFSKLSVPVIAIVLSEGGSGGALALTVSDYIYMFENAIYSILSPEGFSSILFKDTSKVKEVADLMKLTSKDLFEAKLVDEIIKEPLGGIKYFGDDYINNIRTNIYEKFQELLALKKEKLLDNRYKKFRRIGEPYGD